jgi:acetyl esterase/lipase
MHISNAYAWIDDRKLRELPSLVECHGYCLNVDYCAYMAHIYTSKSADTMNPMAWPYHASQEELEGLPPHCLAMDELSPLRDEGVAYARKLAQAGVHTVSQINMACAHGTASIYRKAVPEIHRPAIRSTAAFAKQV